MQKSSAVLKVVLAALVLATTSMAFAEASRPTRFWNLTRHTISELSLAPAGTTDFGPNQCKNDKDGTVDPDERLRITGVAPGAYDAKIKDTSGRSCLVRNVKVEAGEIFSIEEKDLTSCTR
jgi:hypothetical protein